jgi:hypothetical protein
VTQSVTLLTGTAAEWAADDIVIPLGEVAFLLSGSKISIMKVGNGVLKFSELPIFCVGLEGDRGDIIVDGGGGLHLDLQNLTPAP